MAGIGRNHGPDFTPVFQRGRPFKLTYERRDYASKQGHPDQSEFTVVKTDFYNDLRDYLSNLAENPHGVHSLDDVAAYNREHESEGGLPGKHDAWPIGDDTFNRSLESRGVEGTDYADALRFIRRKSREEGIDAALCHPGGDLHGLLVPIQAEDGVATQVAAKAGKSRRSPDRQAKDRGCSR